MVSLTVIPAMPIDGALPIDVALPIDEQVSAGVGSRRTPFPVARRIGDQARDGPVHLEDGDGASLCEAVPQHELQRLAVAWADIGSVARCRSCELLGCSTLPDGHAPHRDEQIPQPRNGSMWTATCSSGTAPVDGRPSHLSASVVAARQLVDDARRARTQISRRPPHPGPPGQRAYGEPRAGHATHGGGRDEGHEP